jgi:PGF-pre-PGF domain-containing protein
VSFDSKKTFGKTTTIAEQLKEKSTLVSGLPSGEVCKSFNVWVGNRGVATSGNIENQVVCFKIEKVWIKDKEVDPDSITLNRYNDKKWEQFPVNLQEKIPNSYISQPKPQGSLHLQ